MNIVEDFVSYFFFFFVCLRFWRFGLRRHDFRLYTHTHNTHTKKWGSIEHFKEVKKAIVSILFAAPGARVRFYQFFFFLNAIGARFEYGAIFMIKEKKKKKQEMQRANYGK